MQITSVTHNPVAAEPPKQSPAGAVVAARPTPANVSAAVLKAAVGDGDGRTGAAALNDGDAASQADAVRRSTSEPDPAVAGWRANM